MIVSLISEAYLVQECTAPHINGDQILRAKKNDKSKKEEAKSSENSTDIL